MRFSPHGGPESTVSAHQIWQGVYAEWRETRERR